MTNTPPKPLTADEIADLKAKAEAATPGPYFAATDEAEDAPDHRGSGLALVDTGRREDWPIARLIEWKQARYIAATPPETILRLIATIEQQREQMEKLCHAWQPIETAPKDGTHILVPSDFSGMEIDEAAYDKNAPAGGGWWSVKLEVWIMPTHWQQLPAPPNEALATTELGR